jgi:hypothetical protein
MFAPIRLRDLGIFLTVTEFDRTEVSSYLDDLLLLGTNVREVISRCFKIRIHVSSELILSLTMYNVVNTVN